MSSSFMHILQVRKQKHEIHKSYDIVYNIASIFDK
jgi:hypothetical protein